MPTSYVPKRLNIVSASCAEESPFGTEATIDQTTDGILLQMDGSTALLMPDAYEFEGDNGPNSIGLLPNRRSPPSGRSASIDIMMYFRGFGAAYSVTDLPPNRFHRLMKGCGYTPTVVVTGGSESVTYAPHGDSTTPTSLTIYSWARQVLGAGNLVRTKMIAGLGSLKIDASDPKPPLFTFGYKGVMPGDPAEAAFTLPTLTSTPIVPNGSDMTFTVDGTALKPYGWNFDQGRDLSSPRVPLTSSGAHLGFVAGHSEPVLKVTLEDELYATWNAYTKRGSAATAAVICGYNQSTQYNRFKTSAPTAQIIKVTPAGKGKVGLVDVEFLLTPSVPTANDGYSFIVD